jgi:hypothetical protein
VISRVGRTDASSLWKKFFLVYGEKKLNLADGSSSKVFRDGEWSETPLIQSRIIFWPAEFPIKCKFVNLDSRGMQ